MNCLSLVELMVYNGGRWSEILLLLLLLLLPLRLLLLMLMMVVIRCCHLIHVRLCTQSDRYTHNVNSHYICISIATLIEMTKRCGWSRLLLLVRTQSHAEWRLMLMMMRMMV